MARSVRIQYPGAFYHVMARGNRRERIYRDEKDRESFYRMMGQACEQCGWRMHAWVLMTNHYHFMVETPEANLVAGMQWLQNSYTRWYNTRHRLWGRLFGDRYKAILIEGGSTYHYTTLMNYIHLNPVRVGQVRVSKGESVRDYPWSSVGKGYALPPWRRERWLAVAEGLARAQCTDTAAGRRRFVEQLDKRAREEGARKAGVIAPIGDQRRSHLRHGWYWGSQAFAERMLKLAGKAMKKRPNRTYRSAAVKKAHDQREAERLLEGGLALMGWDKEMLESLPGSDVSKVALANLLLSRTIVRQSWVGERLAMGSAANVSQQVRRYRAKSPKLPREIAAYLRSVKIC